MYKIQKIKYRQVEAKIIKGHVISANFKGSCLDCPSKHVCQI